MKVTQEQFNELVFFALQIHSAKLQSKERALNSWVTEWGTAYDMIPLSDARNTLIIVARGLFCARFHRIESTSMPNYLHQRFDRHSHYAKQLFNNLKRIAGEAWSINTWSSFLDCLSIIGKTSSDLEEAKDKTPISMLPSWISHQELSDKEYIEAYKQYKQQIIESLNSHFNCHYDYTYLGNDHPVIFQHFLEVYAPEILTTIAITSAVYYFNPLSEFARVIASNLPSWLTGADIAHLVAFKMLEQKPFSTGEPEYLFNPHRHVKIWLSNNKEQFMNPENQLRLVKMRVDNPEDQINLVYAAILLSKKAQQELELFCKKHKIHPVCIEEDVIPKCKNDIEQQLVQLYQDEIYSLNQGGNLGSASDLLRWLSPIYLLGTYSDLDVSINTKNMPPQKVVSSPLLLSIGSIKSTRFWEVLAFNNDRISIVDPIAAAKQIETIQNALIFNCTSENPLHLRIARMQEIQKKITRGGTFSPDDLFVLTLNYIKTHYQIENLPQLRQIIQNVTATKESFIELLIKSAPELTLPDDEIEQTLGLELEPDALKTLQEGMLKYFVICTTGPDVLLSLFKKSVMSSREIKAHVDHYTYEKNELSALFSSGNAIKLHSSQHNADLQGEPGISNDASWLPTGREYVKRREENLHQKARVIQKQFKKIMQIKETEGHDESHMSKPN